jgi:hypothetical protein
MSYSQSSKTKAARKNVGLGPCHTKRSEGSTTS